MYSDDSKSNFPSLSFILVSFKQAAFISRFWRFFFLYYTYCIMYSMTEMYSNDSLSNFAFILGSVNHLLLVTNSSVNFVIYCCMARRFRKALIDLFRSWRCYCRCQEEVNDLAAPTPMSNFFSTSKGRQRGFGEEDASSRYN